MRAQEEILLSARKEGNIGRLEELRKQLTADVSALANVNTDFMASHTPSPLRRVATDDTNLRKVNKTDIRRLATISSDHLSVPDSVPT